MATADNCDHMAEWGGPNPGSSSCRGFFVLGPSFLDRPFAYIASPYKRSDTYGALFHQDEGMSCPRHDDLRAVGVEHGATRTAGRLAAIGAKKAEFRQWTVPCYTRDDPSGYGPNRRTRFSYTERLWYLPTSKILIVDLWETPDLERILADARWT